MGITWPHQLGKQWSIPACAGETEEALTGWVCGPDGLALSAGLNAALSEIRFGVAPAKNLPTSPALGPAPAADEVAVPAAETLPS